VSLGSNVFTTRKRSREPALNVTTCHQINWQYLTRCDVSKKPKNRRTVQFRKNSRWIWLPYRIQTCKNGQSQKRNVPNRGNNYVLFMFELDDECKIIKTRRNQHSQECNNPHRQCFSVLRGLDHWLFNSKINGFQDSRWNISTSSLVI